MVSPEELEAIFAVMARHRVTKLRLEGVLEAEMVLRPRVAYSVPIEEDQDGSEESDDDLDASTRVMMPDSPFESVYDDPDLYPDGVDPVAEMNARRGVSHEQ